MQDILRDVKRPNLDPNKVYGYCVRCKYLRPMVQVTLMVIHGRIQAKSYCEVCHGRLTRIFGGNGHYYEG